MLDTGYWILDAGYWMQFPEVVPKVPRVPKVPETNTEQGTPILDLRRFTNRLSD
jgi:hypothetical protein